MSDSFNVTHNKIVICRSDAKSTREVFDFQVEDNENFFVKTAKGKYQLVHNCLLKPVESPPKSTTWIFGSMDPEKFQTTQKGKALANRCQQFSLKAPSDEDLTLYGRRIIKGEGLTFFTKEVLQKLVENCDREMRSLALLIQSANQYYKGLEKSERPDKLSPENVTEILKSATAEDDVTAVRILVSLYARKFTAAQRDILNIQDGFGMVMKLTNLNWFVMNTVILKGGKHPKLWGNRHGYELLKGFHDVVEKYGPTDLMQQVQMLGQIQDSLVQLRVKAQAFALPEQMVISTTLFSLIQELKGKFKCAS